MTRVGQGLWAIVLLASVALWERPACAQGLSFQFATGGGPTPNGLLAYPYGLAIGPNGTILVADTENNRIQVFRQPQRRAPGTADGRSPALARCPSKG